MSHLSDEPLAYILGAMLLLSLLLFLVSLRLLRVGRSNTYWWKRREAGQRGAQLFLMSLALFGLTVMVGVLTGMAETLLGNVIARPTANVVIATDTPLPPSPDIDATVVAALTGTAANLPTATPTPTMTPTTTATPTLTVTPLLDFVPPTSSMPPLPGARLQIAGISAENGGPYTDSFPAGIQRLYITLEFQDMHNGVTWSRALYFQGVVIQAGTYTWRAGQRGTDVFFFGRETSYPAGAYEARLFLGAIEVERVTFTIDGL